MPPTGRPPGVVITGIGVVSPFGVGRERYWHHVSRGCSGTRAITQFDVSTYPCQVAAAWVPPSRSTMPTRSSSRATTSTTDVPIPSATSRAALFGVIAAREAWRDAGLRAGEPGAGVLIGSGGGGIDVGERSTRTSSPTGGRT